MPSRRSRPAAQLAIGPVATDVPLGPALRGGYCALGLATGAYLVALAVLQPSRHLVGLAGPAIEVVAASLCLARGFANRPGREAARILGCGALFWTAGDVLQALHVQTGLSLSSWVVISLHLAFYPAATIGLLAFFSPQLRDLDLSEVLDGAIAGLGMAGVCAAFTLGSGNWAVQGAMATGAHLGEAAGNLLLIAALAGCFAAMSGRPAKASLTLGVAMILAVTATTSALYQVSHGQSHFGLILSSTPWPVVAFLISTSVWLRGGPARTAKLEERSSFALPGIATAAALALSFVGTVVPLSHVALMLATLTMGGAGVRLFLLVQATQAISRLKHEQSLTDDLTGLRNRRYLSYMLDAFFEGNTTVPDGGKLAFLFVDLDRFKEINDSFGHSAGDQLLRLLGARLRGSLRESDVLVRFGGDEFAVLLPDSDAEAATTVAVRLSVCLEQPFQLERVGVSIGASIGIAMAPDDAQDSERLIQCADLAMYRAKVEGTRLAHYESRIDVERDRIQLLEDLHTAVEEGELMLHYQPQLDLRRGTLVSVEALLRWCHPRLGQLSPPHFLPLAEEAGIMHSITAWVLDRAVAQCARWRASGYALSVAVNISPSNLLENDLVALIGETLERHQVDPAALVLEITENWVTSDFERALRVIRRLGGLGITISIDDFGAGTTSLAYLSNLPVGELKLDRAFAAAVSGGGGDRKIDLVRSTIELGHAIGLRIVAEGVEDAETLEQLSRLGCDLAQGYHICRPKPANELAFQRRTSRRAA